MISTSRFRCWRSSRHWKELFLRNNCAAHSKFENYMDQKKSRNKNVRDVHKGSIWSWVQIHLYGGLIVMGKKTDRFFSDGWNACSFLTYVFNSVSQNANYVFLFKKSYRNENSVFHFASIKKKYFHYSKQLSKIKHTLKYWD